MQTITQCQTVFWNLNCYKSDFKKVFSWKYMETKRRRISKILPLAKTVVHLTNPYLHRMFWQKLLWTSKQVLKFRSEVFSKFKQDVKKAKKLPKIKTVENVISWPRSSHALQNTVPSFFSVASVLDPFLRGY